MSKDPQMVKGFSGYWLIDEESKVYSQTNSKHVYKAKALDYPSENKLSYIIVDKNYNFITDNENNVND